MTVSPLLIWAVTRLGPAATVLNAVCVILLIAVLMLSLAYIASVLADDSVTRGRLKCLRYRTLVVLLIAATLVRVSLPTQKEACAMLLIPAVVNSPAAQRCSGALLSLLDSCLDSTGAGQSSPAKP